MSSILRKTLWSHGLKACGILPRDCQAHITADWIVFIARWAVSVTVIMGLLVAWLLFWLVCCRAWHLTDGNHGNHILHLSPCRYLIHHTTVSSRLRGAWVLFVPACTNRYAAKCAYLSRSGDRHEQTLELSRHGRSLSLRSRENSHDISTQWLQPLGNGHGKQ